MWTIMGEPEILPYDVQQEQVCHECFQYLSVPPVVINRHGEVICGRCNSSTKSQNTKSLYNTVAEIFLFKCGNHFNGCRQLLALTDVEKHEAFCCQYKSQECFLCSFSGKLSQVLQHSMKFHQEYVSFDGIISFSLNDNDLHRPLLFILKDNIFVVHIKATLEFFALTIKSIIKPLPNLINQFGVKFFRPEEPSNFELVHTDYSLLNVNFESYFKKAKEELAAIFGSGAKVCCQILVDSFILEAKESEFQKRYARLRHAEEDLRDLKRNIESREQKLSYQIDTYDSAMDIIKIMSYNLFKCIKCQKTNPNIMFFCSKVHCYCKDCLTNVCQVCNTPRIFKRLNYVEKFVVSCDWPGCKENLELKHYLQHKTECSQRRYKCPLQDCNEVILSAGKLVEHWHNEIPRILDGESITYEKYDSEELFWILKNDLYRVLVKFDADNVEVLIEEISVLPNETKFKCEGYVKDCFDGICWHELKSTDFCGKFQINIANSIPVQNAENQNENGKITQLKLSA